MHAIRWIAVSMSLLCAACQTDYRKIMPPRAEPANAAAVCPESLAAAADSDYGRALIEHVDSAKFYLKLVSARHLSGTPMDLSMSEWNVPVVNSTQQLQKTQT